MCKKDVVKRNYYERHIKLCLLNKQIRNYPGSSKWERMVSKFFIDRDIPFVSQKSFEKLVNIKRLPYDYYLEQYNTLIEVNGKQHYEPTSYRNSEEKYKEVVRHDKKKYDYANSNGILLHVIDTREHNSMDKIHKHLETLIITQIAVKHNKHNCLMEPSKLKAHLDKHPTHYLDPKDNKLKTKKGKLVKVIKGKGNKSKANKKAKYAPKNPEKAAIRKAQRIARKKWRAKQKKQPQT